MQPESLGPVPEIAGLSLLIPERKIYTPRGI